MPELFDTGDFFNLAPLETGDGERQLADKLRAIEAAADLDARQGELELEGDPAP